MRLFSKRQAEALSDGVSDSSGDDSSGAWKARARRRQKKQRKSKKSGDRSRKSSKPKKRLTQASIKASTARLSKARPDANASATASRDHSKSTTTKKNIDALLASTEVIEIDGDAESVSSSASSKPEHVWLSHPSPRLTSKWWRQYLVFDPIKHPGKQHIAVCNVGGDCHGVGGCGDVLNVKNGTGGLKRHLAHKHPTLLNALLFGSPSSEDNFDNKKSRKSKWVTPPLKGRYFQPEDTLEQKKKTFLASVLYYSYTRSICFSEFEDSAFRGLFEPFHRDAKAIVKAANRQSIRSGILQLGEIAKQCTVIEQSKHKGAITSDHWTGPNNETYTTTTYHYIEDWKLKRFLVDFKAYKGRATGEAVFQDQKKVLKLDEEDRSPFCFFACTDTTGSMGTLGAYYRENGIEHGYCVDHNLHRNAIHAFQGESQNLNF